MKQANKSVNDDNQIDSSGPAKNGSATVYNQIKMGIDMLLDSDDDDLDMKYQDDNALIEKDLDNWI